MSYHLPGIPPYPAPPHLEQSMLVKYLHDVCSHTENQIHSNEQTHFLWIHTRVDGCFHIQTNDLKKINPDILLHSLTHPPILIYLKSAEPPMPRVTATPAPPHQAGIPLRVQPHLIPQVAPPNPGTAQWRLLLLRGSQYPVDGAIGQKDPD